MVASAAYATHVTDIGRDFWLEGYSTKTRLLVTIPVPFHGTGRLASRKATEMVWACETHGQKDKPCSGNQGRNHVFKVGGPISWSEVLLPFSGKKV